MMAYLDLSSLKPHLHRWRFNLKTGATTEQKLGDDLVEFGTINQRYAGRPYRYGYSAVGKSGMFLFEALTKHDLLTGENITIKLAEGEYASESPFAPRVGAKDEDDGYVVSFTTNEAQGRSECLIIDAKRFADGPIARVLLPHKICSGTHACWAGRKFIENGIDP